MPRLPSLINISAFQPRWAPLQTQGGKKILGNEILIPSMSRITLPWKFSSRNKELAKVKKRLEIKIPSVVLLGEFQAWIKEFKNYLKIQE